MAEALLSPGVLARENDQSFLTQQPIQAGAALIGPSVIGPVNIPTIVTTYTDFVNKSGSTFISGGQEYSYLTNISAFNYFSNGGQTLLITRVVPSASVWTPAYTFATTGSQIFNPINTAGGAFVLKTISEGSIMNNSGSQDIYGALVSGSSNNVRW